MDCSVIIPARNEAQTLPPLLTALHALHVEILVVDDHSTDATLAVAAQHGAVVLRNLDAPGYGPALRTGLVFAAGRWVTIMTADGADTPSDLERMWLVRYHAPCIFGDRWQDGGTVSGYPLVKSWANRLGNAWIARQTHTSYTDWTNPFKLYPTARVQRILPACHAVGFSAGLEIALRVWQQEPDYAVVPHHWQERRAGRSKFRLAREVREYLATIHAVLGEGSHAAVAAR